MATPPFRTSARSRTTDVSPDPAPVDRAPVTLARARVRELAERLAMEYAGAVPPGQVLALVFRADRALATSVSLSPEGRLRACESVARRGLTEAVALASVAARTA